MSNEVDLITKLMLAQVSACSCQTKTSEAAWHDTYCLYRVLAEAVERITRQSVELERLKEVTNFKDAVACVFDMLKYAAANTSSREWDDQLEDLAEDVIEYAPEYKRQWKDIGTLSAKLSAAEAEIAELKVDKARLDFWETVPRYIGGFAPSREWSFFHPEGTCYGKTLREAFDQLQVMHADLTRGSDTTKRH